MRTRHPRDVEDTAKRPPRRGERAVTDGGRRRDHEGPPEGGGSRSRDAAAHAAAVVEALSGYDRLLEVGIGERTDVALRLAGRGADVLAVDVRDVGAPGDVAFVREDVTEADPARYRDVDAVYALRLPPELQATVADLARAVEADLAFTTLGGDPATVSTRPETLPGGTLHWLVDRGERG